MFFDIFYIRQKCKRIVFFSKKLFKRCASNGGRLSRHVNCYQELSFSATQNLLYVINNEYNKLSIARKGINHATSSIKIMPTSFVDYQLYLPPLRISFSYRPTCRSYRPTSIIMRFTRLRVSNFKCKHFSLILCDNRKSTENLSYLPSQLV